MPTVEFNIPELERLLGLRLPRDVEALNEYFAYVKGDIAYLEGEEVSVEVKDSNHPDLWGVEGISRALKGYMGIEEGLKPYYIARRSRVAISVHEALADIRPYIACGVVRNVELTDEAIKGLMRLQDKLDQTYGRGRRRTSIGLYDYDLITPPIHYTVSKPDEHSFIPLGFQENLSLREILQKHPKGVEYGHIVEGFRLWPLLKDDEGKILSFPPIINSNDLGKVTEATENILVEVTGTKEETVNDALTIMCTALADRGGEIESVEVNYTFPERRVVETPILNTVKLKLTADYVERILGVKLSLNQISNLLRRARFDVKMLDDGSMEVEAPCYRKDILHPIDLVEDISIAYDLNKIPPRWPVSQTFGSLTPKTQLLEKVRELAVGYGLQEVLSFTLTNKEDLFNKMNLQYMDVVEVENPKTPKYTCLRTWIIPSLMDFLQHNIHFEYPQRVFEVGDCVVPARKGHIEEKVKLGIAIAYKNAGFTEVKSILDSLSVNFGIEVKVKETIHGSFIDGRVGKIFSNQGEIGIIGEIHPAVLTNWGLNVPVSALEIDVTSFAGVNTHPKAKIE
ncbi:MAG: phenylalanine--tRNA ligase subunit beta [Candidatus Bathyarchaeia archaeon]